LSYIQLKNVSVEYPIYDSHARSLKLNLLSRVGGGLARGARGSVSVQALRNLNLSLTAGNRLGLIGRNGAGKSTLLKVLAGVYEPSRGTATIVGRVSSLLDMSMGMDLEATGAENVVMRAVFLGMTYSDAKALLPEVEEFCELGDYFYLPMRTYSTGMMLRLAFGATTAISPEILLMDELIGVGDAAFASKAQVRLEALIGRAKILALASHSSVTIRSLCNRVLIIENGTIAFDGKVDEALALYQDSVTAHKAVTGSSRG
jgi:ABC-2 type transport system ATP-binding protein/lipopolysaccharide transport system ATP-binding protein